MRAVWLFVARPGIVIARNLLFLSTNFFTKTWARKTEGVQELFFVNIKPLEVTNSTCQAMLCLNGIG